ncbi:hypothetical protein E2542_SST23139 [Spatholobus suberectus]|nr:hypothetical protein E2542_SST23139 [Spatholobus suberectus]
MSTILLSKFLLLLLLLLNPHANNTKGCSTFVCVAAARPLEHVNVPKFINLKPEKGNGKRGFHGGSVEACLPKGFRRSSAPSRYINYQPLGTTCSSGKDVTGADPGTTKLIIRMLRERTCSTRCKKIMRDLYTRSQKRAPFLLRGSGTSMGTASGPCTHDLLAPMTELGGTRVRLRNILMVGGLIPRKGKNSPMAR